MQRKSWTVALIVPVAIMAGSASAGCQGRGTDCSLNGLCDDAESSGGMGGAGGGAPKPACGDGSLDPREACDDGNAQAGDGCSASCSIEPGFTCAGKVCSDIDECADGTARCASKATCTNQPGSFSCKCPPHFQDTKSDGSVCDPYASCKALKAAEAEAVDAEYLIDPDGPGSTSPFLVYCDMTTAGGGWTLVFNAGTSFDPKAAGQTDQTGYMADATNLAFSTVPITGDIMLDASDSPITGESQRVRSVIQGVHASALNKTVDTLMNGASPAFLDRDDNSNVTNIFASGDCASLKDWPPDPADTQDYKAAICSKAVLTLADRNNCDGKPLSIGTYASSTTVNGNCAGWPQDPNAAATNYWPDHFRMWVR